MLQGGLPITDPRYKELLGAVFKLAKTEFARCFAPPPPCPEASIRAHSVQNARCLDLLAEDGHVIAPRVRYSALSGPLIEFARVGRNQATTFKGICERHDGQIFAPIETEPWNLASPEHLFLFAYRATFYEVHATSAAAWQIQMGYQKRVELGLDPTQDISEAGLLATHRLTVAYETFLYKTTFDGAYLSRTFDQVAHDLIMLDTAQPTVAACSLFSLDHLSGKDGGPVHVCLNIWPIEETKTAVLLSYLQADATPARGELRRILDSEGFYQKYELSRRLLNSCENFVISPRYEATWSAEKREVIRDFFVHTIAHDDFNREHPDLYLF